MLVLLLTVSIILDASGSVRVTGFDASRLSVEEAAQIFTVRLDTPASPDVPPVLGGYAVKDGELVFTPRYPLQQGLTYRVILTLPGQPRVILQRFTIRKPDVASTTVVEHVYPSASDLPENMLKFYIHFSASMSRGEAYRHIHLLDMSGRTVTLPFLELAQELWDESGRRLTLYFDPGRIKSGLLPRNEAGPPLREGGTYTLVIDQDWRDGASELLKTGFRKTFRVGPPEHRPIDVSKWKVMTPKAGTAAALTVDFPKPLDRALLEHEIEIADTSGRLVTGAIQIDRDETRWRFVPLRPWKSGSYLLRVGTLLADLAGNMVDRPFEVDTFEKIEPGKAREIRALTFKIE